MPANIFGHQKALSPQDQDILARKGTFTKEDWSWLTESWTAYSGWTITELAPDSVTCKICWDNDVCAECHGNYPHTCPADCGDGTCPEQIHQPEPVWATPFVGQHWPPEPPTATIIEVDPSTLDESFRYLIRTGTDCADIIGPWLYRYTFEPDTGKYYMVFLEELNRHFSVVPEFGCFLTYDQSAVLQRIPEGTYEWRGRRWLANVINVHAGYLDFYVPNNVTGPRLERLPAQAHYYAVDQGGKGTIVEVQSGR